MLIIKPEHEIEALLNARKLTLNGELFVCCQVREYLGYVHKYDYFRTEFTQIINEIKEYIPGYKTVETYLYGRSYTVLEKEQREAVKVFRLRMIKEMLEKRGVTC